MKQTAKKTLNSSAQSSTNKTTKLGTFLVGLGVTLITSVTSYADIDVARSYLDQGKYEQALLELDGDIATNPQDPEARFIKGVVLQALKRNDAAIEVYAELARDFPELPEPYNNLAVLWADKKEFNKAEDALRAAIKTNKSYATAYENLGDLFAQRASIAYGDALALEPPNRSSVEIKLSMIDNILLPPEARRSAATPLPLIEHHPQRPVVIVQTQLTHYAI